MRKIIVEPVKAAAVDTHIDLKALGEKLGVKKLNFASAERLQQYLGITAGNQVQIIDI